MADTTYATPTDLVPRLGGSVTSGGGNPNLAALTPTLQLLLNAAAEKVDRESRQPQPLRDPDTGVRYEAFSATESLVRTYYDDPSGVLRLDDLLTCTSVVRGATTLDPIYYDLEPLNTTPKTRLVFHGDTPGIPLAFWLDRRYPRAWSGGSVGLVAVTGIWGYCTAATRPAKVKELVLILAERAFERIGKTPTLDQALLAQEIASAWQGLDRAVRADFADFRREGRTLFA